MTTLTSLDKIRQPRVAVRHVPMLKSLEWLRRGWDDLQHVWAPSLGHGALIATLGAVLLILGTSHPYLTAAAVSGYLLVGPIMTTGVCELSRRRAANQPLGFDESLESLTRSPASLMQFGALLAVIAVVWFVVSELMVRSVLHTSGPDLAKALWGGFMDGPQLLAYIASGAVLAGIVFTLSVVAVPLIIDRRASALEAMWVSVKATFWNLPAMLIWSTLIVALTALGFLTMLLGMVVVAPLLGHATWHAYRDLVQDQ